MQMEPKRPMGHYQVDQRKYHVSPRRGKGVERLLEEIMAEYFPNLMKDMNINKT